MKKYCFLSTIIILFCTCTNNNPQPVTSAVPGTAESKADSFFPVTSFIKGQIITLDSLPVTPLQLTIIKEKTDSVWLPKTKLKPLLTAFLNPEIKETNLVKYFKETKFNDQTLNAITFTYDPINVLPDSISLRHWDIYVNPETGTVVKVYIVKNVKEDGRLLTQQLTWQTNKRAKIATILNKPDGTMELLKEVVFIWDFTPVP